MTRTKIAKLRNEWKSLRRKGGVKSSELQSLARKLRRKRHDRGKEPTWISQCFPDLRPISIPDHPGDLNKFTAAGILGQLEEDLERFEEALENGD